jgi:hypothetical protein
MLTTEENEALCRVGPGTPMGKVLRRTAVSCRRARTARPRYRTTTRTAYARPAAHVRATASGSRWPRARDRR